MRQSKISTVVLLTTVAALTSSATAGPVGTTYTLTMKNLPVNITLNDAEFDPDETDFDEGGGGVVSEVAGYNNDHDFVEFWIEWFDQMVPDEDMAGGIEIHGLDVSGTGGRIVRNSAFLYFTEDLAPLRLVDTGSLNVHLASHPLDGNIQVLSLNNPSVRADGFGFSSSDFGADGMRSLMLELGIEDPELVNNLHFGFRIDQSQTPEPSTLTLLGIGALAVLRVGRSKQRRFGA